jgi:flagellar biosynthesis anti-sigma factor FlgM
MAVIFKPNSTFTRPLRCKGKSWTRPNPKKRKPPQQDRVALSARGQSIADAQRAAASVPDIRESLVSRIQTDMQNGTYVVDNQKAAEGLLRESMVNQAALV